MLGQAKIFEAEATDVAVFETAVTAAELALEDVGQVVVLVIVEQIVAL